MDLYSDGKMFAVKMGNTSAKLCYVIDQSLTALKAYRNHSIAFSSEINTVVLWIVLDTATHIEDENGKPDLNRLKMLMLKNRLDQWKKRLESKDISHSSISITINDDFHARYSVSNSGLLYFD